MKNEPTKAQLELTLSAADLPAALTNPKGLARKEDPGTSHAGGRSVRHRSGSQQMRLLRTYVSGPRTDEEAATAADLHRVGVCYWKRCSELREGALTAPTGETRTSGAGEQQRVCALTEAGARLLRELGL